MDPWTDYSALPRLAASRNARGRPAGDQFACGELSNHLVCLLAVRTGAGYRVKLTGIKVNVN
jgi:hypothetical protein